MATSVPSTMRAWRYHSPTANLASALQCSDSAPAPSPASCGASEVIIKVYSFSTNPVDYKIPQLGLINRLMVSLPASPGQDVCGQVVHIGSSVTNVSSGDIVTGSAMKPIQFGAAAEYARLPAASITNLPPSLARSRASWNAVSALGTAGLTALQCLQNYASKGDRVFINGGSGGTGTFAIQIGKALGLHITTSCSTPNIELCKRLGADEVLDYKTVDIVQNLSARGPSSFKLVVDFATAPQNLYRSSKAFLDPRGTFLQVGGAPSVSLAASVASNILRPAILGGGKAKYVPFIMSNVREDWERMVHMVETGELKPVVESTWSFEQVKEAYERQMSGRAKGNIVVHVGGKGDDE